jgi:hypothetical protein
MNGREPGKCPEPLRSDTGRVLSFTPLFQQRALAYFLRILAENPVYFSNGMPGSSTVTVQFNSGTCNRLIEVF